MKKLLIYLLLMFPVPVFAQGIARDINVEEFSKRMTEKPGLLLDVRTPGEVSKGIIKGAVVKNIFDDDFETYINSLDRKKPVYVYCATGGRSGEAMEMMQKKGFSEVYNLDGGYKAWKASGKP